MLLRSEDHEDRHDGQCSEREDREHDDIDDDGGNIPYPIRRRRLQSAERALIDSATCEHLRGRCLELILGIHGHASVG